MYVCMYTHLHPTIKVQCIMWSKRSNGAHWIVSRAGIQERAGVQILKNNVNSDLKSRSSIIIFFQIVSPFIIEWVAREPISHSFNTIILRQKIM